MQTHPTEIAAIEAAARTGHQRHNAYAGIHKALRAFMADTLQRIGRADPADEAEVHDAVSQLLELADLCERHVQHENNFVHPALDARCPGVAQQVSDEHEEHLRHIGRLRDAAWAIARAPADERATALHALYLALGLFVADNLQHMHVEETVHNAALWAAFSDEELLAIHNALVATIPPEEMLMVVRWMLPQLSLPEQVEMLQGMRMGAPEPFFNAVLDVARQHLSQTAWAKLARGLGLAPVPGLVAV
jgi:hypothetical protein